MGNIQTGGGDNDDESHQHQQQQRTRKGRNKSGTKNRSKLIKKPSQKIVQSRKESLVRVGSELFSIVDGDDHGGTAQQKATNYDHVRKAVMYNLFQAGSLDPGKGVPGVVGFRNLGNSCYMNSALQCLSNTIPLTEYFLGYDYQSEINTDNRLGSGGELVTAYAALMKRIWLKPAKSTEDRRVLVTKGFKKRVASFASEFEGDDQHDAHEFIATLLDGIHEDLNRIKGPKPYIEEGDNDGSKDQEDCAVNAWERYLMRDKSAVVDMFQGQLRSETTCRDCSHKNIRFEAFMYLSLPVTDDCKSLDDALDLFVKKEKLVGDNQWYCGKCAKHCNATKKTDIWVLPPVLMVHLKRFKVDKTGQNGEKIRAEMKYPLSGWDLSKKTKSKGGGISVYELYASANHWGDVDDGHYTAYALNQFDQTWYEFDDNMHEEIDAESIFESSAAPYVLFFHRASTVSAEDGASIHRQSASLPHLWPHVQESKGADDMNEPKLAKKASKKKLKKGKSKKNKALAIGTLGTLDEEDDDITENGSVMGDSVMNGDGEGKKKKNKKKDKLKKSKSSKSVSSKAKKKDKQHITIERATNYDHVKDIVLKNFIDAGCLEEKGGAPAGVVGLRNLGNTCYMNSALQCLSNTEPLTDYFLGYDYQSEINKDNFLGTSGELVTAYAELLQKMWLKTSAKRRVVVTRGFKKAISKFGPQFKGSRQHDSHELLACILDGIHEDLNRVKERKYIEEKTFNGENDEDDAVKAWECYLQRNRSMVVDLFQGQLRNSCKCHACGTVSIRFEPFMYLSLPVNDECESVDDCLELFLAEEELTRENQFFCETCSCHVDAIKKTDLWVVPPVLIIHLKRFEFDDHGEDGSKITTPLNYPVTKWDLSKSVKREGSSAAYYDMYASSNHLGCLDYGHYTAYALNRMDKKWYEFNDNEFKEIDPIHKFESSPAPYMLFYRRSGNLDADASIHRQSLGLPTLWPHAQSRALPDDDGIAALPSMAPPLKRETTAGRRQSDGLIVGRQMQSRKVSVVAGSLQPPMRSLVEFDDDDEEDDEESGEFVVGQHDERDDEDEGVEQIVKNGNGALNGHDDKVINDTSIDGDALMH